MYILDTNIFIEAKNSYYAADICPAFWTFIEQQIHQDQVRSVESVFNELKAGDATDWITVWAKANQHAFISPNNLTQNNYKLVVNYVHNNFNPRQQAVRNFLAKADPWVIAEAITSNCVLVTHESKVFNGSSKPKIPNIAENFNVRCITTWQLLRELNACFK